MIAHEAIFDIHRELFASESSSVETEGLLEESARVVVVTLPTVTATASAFATRWTERSLLDPGEANRALGQFEEEMRRIGPQLDELLDRQRQIARHLRDRLER